MEVPAPDAEEARLKLFDLLARTLRDLAIPGCDVAGLATRSAAQLGLFAAELRERERRDRDGLFAGAGQNGTGKR